ncbi:MAG TPA: universal stress protein [Polyangiaceae bacterium]|nr:universal stress protein [Polyangiaceae bacterium]
MPNKPYVVVVGTDYSQPAEEALRRAYAQALPQSPAELHVVHVSLASGADGSFPVPPFAGLGAVPVLSLDEQKDRLVKYLDGVIPTLAGFRDSGIRVYAHIALDTPVFGVTNLATKLEADLIVVGSHGRHGLARWVLGSVAEGIVRQAPCPVLVVPPEAKEQTPQIEPPCPRCVAARESSERREMWCEQHREHHGRRHTYHQGDRVGAETNFPLVTR